MDSNANGENQAPPDCKDMPISSPDEESQTEGPSINFLSLPWPAQDLVLSGLSLRELNTFIECSKMAYSLFRSLPSSTRLMNSSFADISFILTCCCDNKPIGLTQCRITADRNLVHLMVPHCFESLDPSDQLYLVGVDGGLIALYDSVEKEVWLFDVQSRRLGVLNISWLILGPQSHICFGLGHKDKIKVLLVAQHNHPMPTAIQEYIIDFAAWSKSKSLYTCVYETYSVKYDPKSWKALVWKDIDVTQIALERAGMGGGHAVNACGYFCWIHGGALLCHEIGTDDVVRVPVNNLGSPQVHLLSISVVRDHFLLAEVSDSNAELCLSRYEPVARTFTNLCTISLGAAICGVLSFEPVMFLLDGSLLVLVNQDSLQAYDLRTGKSHTIALLCGMSNVHAYSGPSLEFLDDECEEDEDEA